MLRVIGCLLKLAVGLFQIYNLIGSAIIDYLNNRVGTVPPQKVLYAGFPNSVFK